MFRRNLTRKMYACDFETTVYDGQEETAVWSAAMLEIKEGCEDVKIFHTIKEWFTFIFYHHRCDQNIYYFHNLKFDGEFILYEILHNMKLEYTDESTYKMKNKTYNVVISDMGMWYSLTIKMWNRLYIFKDSLKLLPYSLKALGEAFQTKHRKLEMEYEGENHYPGCVITDEEKAYIENDVLVLSEALQKMFAEGHTKLTIGSCALAYFRQLFSKDKWKELFPRCDLMTIDNSEHDYGSENVDEYIRRSYVGGWCYCKDEDLHVTEPGVTFDVNSLYPSMLHSKSGNKYPVGKPTFWYGNYDMKNHLRNSKTYYFFYRVRVKFDVKPGHPPFIHLRRHPFFKSTEIVKSSTPEILKKVKNISGDLLKGYIVMTLTETDLNMLFEHYDVSYFEILDGCYFKTRVGIFDEYIDNFMEMKAQATIDGNKVKRNISKLFLNSLYGKLATSSNSSIKIPFYDNETDTIRYEVKYENNKKPVYIPCGSACTSYARRFTITGAYNNYEYFHYADTDSIHMTIPKGGLTEIKGIVEHDTDLCCWKKECEWNEALFVRAKTYIEVIDGEYDVKCAGMPKNCKNKVINDFNNPKKAFTMN